MHPPIPLRRFRLRTHSETCAFHVRLITEISIAKVVISLVILGNEFETRRPPLPEKTTPTQLTTSCAVSSE